jgi:DnaK suppressor protein
MSNPNIQADTTIWKTKTIPCFHGSKIIWIIIQFKGVFLDLCFNLERLVIICGVSNVGKSTLIDRIREGEIPSLNKHLGIGNCTSWGIYHAWALDFFYCLSANQVISHYDLFRPYYHGHRVFTKDKILKKLVSAEHTFLGHKSLMKNKQKRELEKHIQNRISTLEKDIQSFKKETRPVAPDNAIGRLTRMEAIGSKSMNEAALRRAEASVSKLKQRLNNIHSPDFGLCGHCEEPIPFNRLMAMPETMVCVDCAEKLSRI